MYTRDMSFLGEAHSKCIPKLKVLRQGLAGNHGWIIPTFPVCCVASPATQYGTRGDTNVPHTVLLLGFRV